MSESQVKERRYDRMNDLYDLVVTTMKEQSECDGAEMAVVLTRVLGDVIANAPPDLRESVVSTLIAHLHDRGLVNASRN